MILRESKRKKSRRKEGIKGGVIMNKKIDLYSFGFCGSYDDFNPYKLYNCKYAAEILFLISDSDPYTLDKYKIAEILRIPPQEISDLLDKLSNLEMISCEKGKYKINFTVFLEKDISIIERFSKEFSKIIGNKIIDNIQKIIDIVKESKAVKRFSKERVLYHMIGDKIFDGTALDYFAEKGLFNVTKKQVSNRDYILIGFEHSEKVDGFSSKLLCSSNNYRSGKFLFNSFGDGDGNRKDLYRFLRNIEQSISKSTEHDKLNEAYNIINSRKNKELVYSLGKLINIFYGTNKSINVFSEEEKEKLELLEQLGYISFRENNIDFVVPVIDHHDHLVIEKLSKYILNLIEEDVTYIFNNLESKIGELSALKHNVKKEEISNELWHQLFGGINEYLIKQGIFSNPEYRNDEGRYFQCIYINRECE